MSAKIRCCSNHTDYPVPVIFTFKWDGYENWCPFCGTNYEFFDNYLYLLETPLLQGRYNAYREKAIPYLKGETENYELNVVIP